MVVIEATWGRYQKRIAADLVSADIPVAVVNPVPGERLCQKPGQARQD